MTRVELSQLRTFETQQAIEWLRKTYGPHGDRWKLISLARVEFKKERDATLFLLHWS